MGNMNRNLSDVLFRVRESDSFLDKAFNLINESTNLFLILVFF